MNEIVNKFLLAGDKFMPEMHLKEPGFTYSACGPFTKNKTRIQNFKEKGDTSYIYKNELDKACLQHDMAYRDFKDLKIRTASDKILRDKAFNIAKNPKYDGYQRGLASKVYKFFDKKSASLTDESVSGSSVANEPNYRLANKLHKPIIRKFKKRKVYSGFKDNIWGADLADMQLISKFNKGFRFSSCVMIFLVNMHGLDKKGISIATGFQKILDQLECKPNKIWVDKGSEFYVNSFKK